MANEMKIASKLVLLNGLPMQLPSRASDPGSAVNGDMYYSSATNKVRVYQNGAWADLNSGSASLVGAALNTSNVIVGDGSNLSAAVDSSALGDVLATTAGGMAIKSGVIVNAQINASAAIDATKIADGSVSNAEFQYLGGVTSDIQTQLGAKAASADVIRKDGTVAFTGDQALGGFKLTGLGLPSGSADAATKGYVDSVAEGLKPKAAARVATTANLGALSGLLTIDGVTVSAGNRILVKDQTAQEDNGIYVAAAGAWARSSDFDAISPIDEINGAMIAIQEGTANAGKIFVQSGVVVTIGTDPIVFIYFNSNAALVGGDGITISGSNVSVDHDGNGLTFVGAQLALELDGATLSTGASGLKVATGGISNNEVAAGAAIAMSKLATLTAQRNVLTNGSGVLVAGSVTDVEMNYLSGVTSNIQTQLNGKANRNLDNLQATTQISVDLIPSSSGTRDLGASSGGIWRNLYIGSVIHPGASQMVIQNTGTNQGILIQSNGTGTIDQLAPTVRRTTDGTNFLEESYQDASTLTNNTTTTVSALTYAAASYEGVEITYKMKQATTNAVRIGTIRVANNASSVSMSDVYAETADCQIIVSAAVNGANIEISFANANATNSVVMRADIKRIRA